jgi:hypothetical protein
MNHKDLATGERYNVRGFHRELIARVVARERSLGRYCSISFACRQLIKLGGYRYDELGRLPEIDG